MTKRSRQCRNRGNVRPDCYGMDLSKPSAVKRWKQILAWVHAECQRCASYVVPGFSEVSSEWKPLTEEEMVEADFIRQLVLTDRGEKIERLLGETSLERAFCLKGNQVTQARALADLYAEPGRIPPVCSYPLTHWLYAWKYNTIRRDRTLRELGVRIRRREPRPEKIERDQALYRRYSEALKDCRSRTQAVLRVIWRDMFEAQKDPYSSKIIILSEREACRVWERFKSGERSRPSDITPFLARVTKRLQRFVLAETAAGEHGLVRHAAGAQPETTPDGTPASGHGRTGGSGSQAPRATAVSMMP